MVLGNAAAAQGDSASALQHIRFVAAHHPQSPVVWNAYARAAACSGSMRNASRYLLGMVKKHPDSVPLMVLLGNSHMITVGTIFSHTYLPYSKQESWPAIRLCMISGCFASAVLNGMPLGQRTADSLAAGVCARLSMHPDVSVHDKLVVAAGLRSTDEGCRSYRTTLLCTNGICEKASDEDGFRCASMVRPMHADSCLHACRAIILRRCTSTCGRTASYHRSHWC